VGKESFFVTGATGFIGSHIVKSLLSQGYTVYCLVRGKNDDEAKKRLIDILSDIPSEEAINYNNLHVFSADVTAPDCGLHKRKQPQGITFFIHSAANIDFTESREGLSSAINADGALNAISLARQCSIPYFFHISTAFVSGKKKGLIRESLDEGTWEFSNVYEESKAEAEKLLTSYTQAHNINLTVLRLGIVVGDSVSGYTPKLNTIYSFLVPLIRIREKADRGVLKKDRLIKVYKDKRVNLPLKVIGYENAHLNLIPVDFVVTSLIELVGLKRKGIHFYHIVDDNPPSMKNVVQYVSEILNITGLELISPEDYPKISKNSIQRIFYKQNSQYMHYTTSQAFFDRRELSSALKRELPSWNEKEFFSLMITFTKKYLHRTKTEISTDRYRDIIDYFQVFLKSRKGQRLIKNLRSFTSHFVISFTDAPLNPWNITIDKGVLITVSQNGSGQNPKCTYSVSARAFREIIKGYMTPQEGFFKGDIDIHGDIRHGLKLASLMEIFFNEHPYKEIKLENNS
jgi:nucleoside-diphosphate-sugar epimerase/putative sterol carrier protein